MRRREFIAGLGAAAWPHPAGAQQQAMPVVGFFRGSPAAGFEHFVAAFRQGLKETGYSDGQNVTIDYRWADGQYDRLIVFGVGDDPVKMGLVASFARPGGNATGTNFFYQEVGEKRLALLHELLPKAVRVAVLINPANAMIAETTLQALRGATRNIGLHMGVLNASTSSDIEGAFAALARERPDALFVAADAFFLSRRVQFATLAARNGIPATYSQRPFVEAGGLMSYGTAIADMYRLVGVYSGNILNGTKPADLPIVQPTQFEFVVNLQTARALGINVPETLLSTADEVIQ
jgi:putative tryptophan/tyrosine transport system substrate-binding protein